MIIAPLYFASKKDFTEIAQFSKKALVSVASVGFLSYPEISL